MKALINIDNAFIDDNFILFEKLVSKNNINNTKLFILNINYNFNYFLNQYYLNILKKYNNFIDLKLIFNKKVKIQLEKLYYEKIITSFYYPTITSSNLKTFLTSPYCDPHLSKIVYSYLL